ncbi:hypothetical protein [Corynebacterium sp. 335C]
MTETPHHDAGIEPPDGGPGRRRRGDGARSVMRHLTSRSSGGAVPGRHPVGGDDAGTAGDAPAATAVTAEALDVRFGGDADAPAPGAQPVLEAELVDESPADDEGGRHAAADGRGTLADAVAADLAGDDAGDGGDAPAHGGATGEGDGDGASPYVIGDQAAEPSDWGTAWGSAGYGGYPATGYAGAAEPGAGYGDHAAGAPAAGDADPYGGDDPYDDGATARFPAVAAGAGAGAAAGAVVTRDATRAHADDDRDRAPHDDYDPYGEHAERAPIPHDFMDERHDRWGIVAESLEVHGSEGPVYGPIDVAVPATGLTVLSGRGGSGRTALALTFAGRMKPTGGRLRVLGMEKRRDIRRHVAIAGVDQLDELERNLTVRATLREYRYWTRTPLWFPPKVDEDYLEEIAGPIYGDRDLPPLDAFVSQLPSLDRHLLRIALALRPAHGTEQEMLIVDDLEQVHELEERLWLLSRLKELAEEIPVVVNAVNPLPESLVPAHRQMRIDADAGHIHPADGGFIRRVRTNDDDDAAEAAKEVLP